MQCEGLNAGLSTAWSSPKCRPFSTITLALMASLQRQGGYLCIRAIFYFIADVWKCEAVPQQWRAANIVTIFKGKGEKSICGNRRGISLLSVTGKVLAKVMLTRLICSITEHLLPKFQCGFRKNHSRVDMIFTARQLQEK